MDTLFAGRKECSSIPPNMMNFCMCHWSSIGVYDHDILHDSQSLIPWGGGGVLSIITAVTTQRYGARQRMPRLLTGMADELEL